ncbi:hypothetical protein F5B22DRAFT_650089 [Xylaria bambusicola]|uniref:uncharacterized protein n=1 Tax=Xylaria bambusicola TaxID=326684 RepID=UPI002007CD04|nr:uncharacterized protein F5B22DRAFT_650089 [Xylaria bambusicola]KAI0508423.1 hypothetical protein F5B22DRAFT_650089 [Xylaria bambusicola]
MSNLTSTGRGGAGNIADATKSPRIEPSDLQTPTLKTPIITTGRGGSGNMKPNVDPVETRARQDVAPVERRLSTTQQHVGRGGAANVAKSESPDPKPSGLDESAAVDDVPTADTNKKQQPGRTAGSLAAKAKDFFKRT